MAAKLKKVDSFRFEGNGISFKAKLIGIDKIDEARGDQICQATITRLKNSVKISGQHKQKIFVNITLEGVKIIDAISMVANQNKKKNDNRQSKSNVDGEETEKPQESLVLHTHAVHQISFISRDVTDNRAFGYIYGSGDGDHRFFAIKTAAAAEQLVLTVRDLFQAVYDLKKQEVDEAKLKLEESQTTENEGNKNSSGNGSTPGIGQFQTPTQNVDGEDIYQVPQNNAPANPGTQQERVANLLDLEDQADQILKGIEQIKNLEFDSLTNENVEKSSNSPVSPAAGNSDPWGATATPTAAASSDLASLGGFNASPFGGQSQAFPVAAFPQSQPVPGMGNANAGLPVTKDPFGNDPFASQFQHPGVRPTAFPATVAAPGFGTVNPFGPPRMGQPYAAAPQPGMAMPAAMMGPPGMMAGMVPRMMAPPPGGPGLANPFSNPFGESDPNVLMPIRNQKDEEPTSAFQEKPKSLHDDLFSDLVGMKKSADGALTPKDMFAQINAPEKKSMNELKSVKDTPGTPASTETAFQASCQKDDPFGETDCIFNDKTRGLVTSDEGDPFDTSHIPALPAVSPAKSSLFTPHPPVTTTSPSSSSSPNAPPVPQRQTLQNSNTLKECSLSSSSSTSLSSSSSAISPPVPSDPPPSISPPPLPVRRKENDSSSSSTPSHLPLTQDPTTSLNNSSTNAFMLPSPDEPPPPLPENVISTPAAPPPPPRPSMRSNPSSSLVHHPKGPVNNTIHHSNLTNTSKSSPASPLSSRENSKSNMANTHSRDSHNISTSQSDTSQSNQSVADPFNISLKPSTGSSLISSNKSDSGVVRFASNSSISSDPFASQTPEKLANSSKVVTDSQNSLPNKEAEEQDPFGLPLHLTPGFKAVAKFGNDPFEDSFHSGFSEFQGQDKWEPFAEPATPKVTDNQGSSDPWNANAFGDVFPTTPPAQPVNGNTSGNSLLD